MILRILNTVWECAPSQSTAKYFFILGMKNSNRILLSRPEQILSVVIEHIYISYTPFPGNVLYFGKQSVGHGFSGGART